MQHDVHAISNVMTARWVLALRIAAWTVCISAFAFASASTEEITPVAVQKITPQKITPMLSTRLNYRIDPFVDMYFSVRAAASKQDELPNVAGFDKAVAAARSLDTELSSPLAWGPIEGLLPQCANAAAAREVFARLPESFELRGGKQVALRKQALELVDALAVLEPAFLKETWPAHQAQIAEANQRIAEGFTPKESVALEFVIKSFELSDDGRPIPVYLVTREPFPGAVTQRDDDDRGVCFVSVDGVQGSQLYETMLHEVTHALDLGSKGVGVLARLRKKLEEAGLTPRDREWRDAPHTLMFVEAGETIRRVIDPAHKHYGDVAGYYDKVRAIADVELDVWKRHLDGEYSADVAIDKIVAAVVAARKAK